MRLGVDIVWGFYCRSGKSRALGMRRNVLQLKRIQNLLGRRFFVKNCRNQKLKSQVMGKEIGFQVLER